MILDNTRLHILKSVDVIPSGRLVVIFGIFNPGALSPEGPTACCCGTAAVAATGDGVGCVDSLLVGTTAGCDFGGGGAGVVGVPTVVVIEDVARPGDEVAGEDGLESAGEETLARSALATAVDNAGFFSGRTPSIIKRLITNPCLVY